MKVVSFVGTRPEIIKTLAFCRAAPRLPGMEFLVVHTGQNFGPNMADCFFRELGVPVLHQNAAIDRSSIGSSAKTMLDCVAEHVRRLSPEVVVSNTDTDTAFYTALAGAKLRVPVAHIEGGIRCEARLNPEEINRRLADHLANWVFTISDEDTHSLLSEGFPRESVFMRGDITLDALRITLAEHHIQVRRGDYNLLTIHRQENANNPKRLATIINAVEQSNFPTVFPVHPRTREGLQTAGLIDRLQKSRVIQLREPQPYIDMVRLAAGCNKVISDSGGLRREGYMLDKPVISLVWFVWFKRMNQLGYEFVADADGDKIAWAIQNFDPPEPRPPIFGDGRAGEHILRTLLEQAQQA